MGGKLSSCAGKGCSCARCDRDEDRKKPLPEKYPKKKPRKQRSTKLKDEVESKKENLTALKTVAAELTPKLSQHDKELVEERVREVERRHIDLESSVDRKLQGYGSLGTDLEAIKEEADLYLTWLDECDGQLQADSSPVGYKVQDVEAQLQELKALETELSQKQTSLDAVMDKAQGLLTDLPSQERDSVEKLLAAVQTRHNELYGAVSSRCRVLEDQAEDRKELSEMMDRVRKVLDKAKNENFDTLRLKAADVEKQLEKCKTLNAKVQNQTERVNEVKAKAEPIREECNEKAKKELDQVLQDLSDHHEAVLKSLKGQQNNLRDCVSSRRKFEGDCQKVERWCRETEAQCEATLPQDLGLEAIEEQQKVYKNLQNTVAVFDSLVKETTELGQSYFPSLAQSDHQELQMILEALQTKFKSVSVQVEEKVQALETHIKAQSYIQDQIKSCGQWLRTMQDELRQSNIPIGHQSQDAELLLKVFENIEEKLSSFQGSMKELNGCVENLRSEGQTTQADEIKHLSDLYDSLTDQTRRHKEACTAAISARQIFEQHILEQEAKVQACIETLLEDSEAGLTLSEHVEKFQSLLEELQQVEPEMSVALDRARKIGHQGTEDDLTAATGRVQDLQTKIADLKESLHENIAKCESIRQEREDFDNAVSDLIAWFEDKEDILATCKVLQLDADKVDPVIVKHKIAATEASERLKVVKEKAEIESSHYESMPEGLPQDLMDKLGQIKSLEDSIMVAVAKKEQYLQEAKGDRIQFENSMHQVTDWLRGAEDLLDSGIDGLDYDTLEGTLSEFTDYFTEASLCQDEMDQVTELTERLLPTLDTNDSTTLKQSLDNVHRKYSNVVQASSNKQNLMETKLAQWKKFQETLSQLNGKLDVLESEWNEVDNNADASPDAVQSHLELVKTFLEHAETSRPVVDDLNDLARDLERSGNHNSRTMVNRLITAVNHRWDTLTGQAESRILSLEEIEGQWVDFSSMMSAVQTLVNESETRMRIISLDGATRDELVAQLDTLKGIDQNLERIEPQVTRLQSTSLTLQRALPTAEAKITSQEQFMVMAERYERLLEKVKEELAGVQEETDSRDEFFTSVNRLSIWLQETLSCVHNLGRSPHDSLDALSKFKIYEQDYHTQVEEASRLEQTQIDKYATQGKTVPEEMSNKLSELRSLEAELQKALEEKHNELVHLKEDRAQYRKLLHEVAAWLQRADQQLQERVFDIAQARQEHQGLLHEFDEFKVKLDQLRTKGGDIIKHSPDPAEKQEVQKTLADINRQWLSLQAQTADRTQELSEAADLSHAIEDLTNGVEIWLEEAESVVGAELVWADFDKVKDHLKAHKRVCKELEANQDKVIALQAMVKQLQQVCDAREDMTKVGDLKSRVETLQTKAGVQLTTLEDANRRLEEFEKEVNELMAWLEHTRSRMTMRDTTRDLKEQLAVQERVYRFVLTSCEPEVKIIERNVFV